MEIDDLGWWDMDPFEGCEIKCPECKEYSSHKDWISTEVPCEDCGEHGAIECPKCGEKIDHVHSPRFEVREPVLIYIAMVKKKVVKGTVKEEETE